MTAREKIIMAVTGIFITWGGVTYFRPLISPAVVSEGETVTAAERAFVERSREQLSVSRLTDAERYVLETAQAEWTNSPPARGESVKVFHPKPHRPADYIYTGFVNMGTERFAIINGHEYRRGEVLKNSAVVVDVIAADHVVLLFENGNKRETVSFQKPVLKGVQ